MKKQYLKIFLFWFVLLGIALVNAILRELWYKPFLEPHIGMWAHQVSSITAIILFFLAIYFFIKKSSYNHSPLELLAMGLVWMAMTIIFELWMNIYIRQLSFVEVIETYYFWKGETWVFVLIAIAVSPIIAGRIKSKNSELEK